MKINTDTWIKEILKNNKRSAIPIMTHPGIDLIGENVESAVKQGEVQYKAVKALSDKYPSDASTMIMDLSVEAEAFGSEIRFNEDDVPDIMNRIVTDGESIQKLQIPELQRARLPEYLNAAKLSAKNIIDHPVFAGCIGPFSLAARLFGVTEIMTEMLMDQESVHKLLKKCNDFLTKYIREFKQTGVDGIVIAEPAAGMLSPEQCMEFSSEYIKQIVDELQDENFIIILHNCGNTNQLLKEMEMTRARGLHFGNSCDIKSALESIDDQVLVMGNLDPVAVFKMGNPDAVYKRTIDLLEKTSEHKNFVLSSGCDIPPAVPLENIDAFYIALEDYNKR